MLVVMLQVRAWFESEGDAYIKKKDLGDSLDAAYTLQEECLKMKASTLVKKFSNIKLKLVNSSDNEIIVSREKVTEFKNWLDR